MKMNAPFPLFALGLLVLSAACNPGTMDWKSVEAPNDNQVVFTRLTHVVRFAAGGASLAAAEATRLDAFLSRQGVDRSDEVTIYPGAGAFGEPQRDAVMHYLAARDVGPVAVAAQEANGKASADEVIIRVGRYVVVPPKCANWSKPAHLDYGNTTMSNLGCSNNAAFGRMVAEPRDLVRGRAIGPADADRSAAAVKRYREGKETPLVREATDKP
jgi:pilus assembly protein CpaD